MNKQLSIAVVLCALLSGFSQAQTPVTCGATITTSAVLTSNLTCPANDPALTIVGPNGSLDMRGFTLSCGGSGAIGIELEGSGAVLQNGTVRDCDWGVLGHDRGDHVVQRMSLRNNLTVQFIVNTPENHITNSTARGGGGDGFEVSGSNNTLTGNTATGNGGDGFLLDGSGGHTLSQNIPQSNREDGIRVQSDNNTLERNTASRNLDDGINVAGGATNNQITATAASGNGSFDLEDENPNCDENVWQNNAGTRNQGCIR